jgi:hypothetical protein
MSDRLYPGVLQLRSAPQLASATNLGFASFGGAELLQPPLRDRHLPRQPEQPRAVPVAHQRTRLWEFGTNLHCSIVGTCLSTAELRQVLGKIGLKEAATASEHDVHASGVLVAGKHRDGAKLLHKALDRRHRLAISRFDKAKSVEEVRALWRKCVQAGDIPAAYWAALTHPEANDALVREIFTEVHMLSHLVGAANRADIRRLRQLETDNAALQEKVERQQQQLRDAIVTRDGKIRELSRVLEQRIEQSADRAVEALVTGPDAGWETLAADLKARLTRTDARRGSVESQLFEARAALASEHDARRAAERCENALRAELDAIEEALTETGGVGGQVEGDARLYGSTLLYVGGRPAQIAHIRAAAERQGAILLHHDGGVEERGGLLPGLVSRADAVLFPVDCISHAAMSVVKRLCQQTGKPFLPLRSVGLAPFCAALKTAALSGPES